MELVQIEKFIGRPAPRSGRKQRERQALAGAFVGKAVNNHPTIRATIEALQASSVLRHICSLVRPSDVPSEAKFSRAFGEFARHGLGERVHAALLARYVKPELAGHISRDATAIRGREKP
ncbi:MAG: IS5/IS1182 family transposase, partial [Deltaproteobacteria bacterium]